jgi:hypothetical protein
MDFDPIAVAEIASTTNDAVTARQLLKLVDRLLTEAGLPPYGPSGRSSQ